MSTARQIITTALRKIASNSANSVPSAEDIDIGLETLNSLIDSKSATLLNIHTITPKRFLFTPGKLDYALGPTGDWVTERPMRLEKAKLILTTSQNNPSPPVVINPLITQSVTATPVEGQPPLLVDFEAKADGDIFVVFWEFGDGGNTASISSTITHEYTTVGTFQPTANIVASNGSSLVDAPVIRVSDEPIDAHRLFLPLESVSQEQFTSIRMRGITNGLPQKILDNGGYPDRSLMFWPIPSDGAVGVELWLWEPLIIYDLDAELNLPKGYERYYIYSLAVELSDTFGKQLTKEIIQSLMEAEAAIKTLNQVEFIAQPSNAAVGISRLGRPYNYIDFVSGAAMLPRQRN